MNRSKLNFAERLYLFEVFKGLWLTSRHFFSNMNKHLARQLGFTRIEKGAVTFQYPEERRPFSPRYRSRHRLTKRDDGSPRCVACLCCSTACPAQCISIDPAEYPEGDARRGYERFPGSFVIDELRCIFCGFCVEACPCDAIRMDTGIHAAPYDSREQFIYRRELLMSFTGRDGSRETENPRHEPGDPTHPGLTRHQLDH